MSGQLSQNKAENRREDFRKYLEKSGVVDAMTKLLVGLYEEPEKPEDALDYVRKQFQGGPIEEVDVIALRNERDELSIKLKEAEDRIKELEQKVETLSTQQPQQTAS
ncbi:hypothetical protein LOD99_7893 [Oopsacas minuta]|uniref:c-Myc-binding protein n=1 Tax=Oopsacas minuta TaxID=111878 RepID=A0AAV7JIR6_9METZ|nr:hypothetical protein LOD99_7893 [Oopsacas minuta]